MSVHALNNILELMVTAANNYVFTANNSIIHPLCELPLQFGVTEGAGAYPSSLDVSCGVRQRPQVHRSSLFLVILLQKL